MVIPAPCSEARNSRRILALVLTSSEVTTSKSLFCTLPSKKIIELSGSRWRGEFGRPGEVTALYAFIASLKARSANSVGGTVDGGANV